MRILFIVLTVLLFGCSDKKEIAFYHWKSKCEVSKDFSYPLYVKVLDIGVKKVIKTNCKRSFVPVVYIDNRALKQRDDIASIILKNISKDKKEVQFDCDWTQSTRKKYFELLAKMKKHYKKITATIRLHQIKYPKKTGIPPVEDAVLMFYNMSDFLDPKTKNYVLDIDEAKKYLKDIKPYPLKLDLALPLYSMMTIFRYGKVVGLVDDIKQKDLDKYFSHLKDSRYKVVKTHYFKGRLLYEGDIVRVDEMSLEILKEATRSVPFEYKRIIYFRYSNLKDWDIKKLIDL